ncbi:MAG: hypothetical protein ACLP0A_14585, partial [Verrucomicrobiia bacterium]
MNEEMAQVWQGQPRQSNSHINKTQMNYGQLEELQILFPNGEWRLIKTSLESASPFVGRNEVFEPVPR